jgi:hypothetical protein
MNVAAVEQIARAVLYEGYLLYPYRRIATKNRSRWTFGCLFPPTYPQPVNSSEGDFSRIECLVIGNAQSTVSITARFLQILTPANSGGKEEIVEREVSFGPLRVCELIAASECHGFDFLPIKGVIELSAEQRQTELFKLRAELRNLTICQRQENPTRDRALPFALLSNHLILGIDEGRFISMQDPPAGIREIANSCRSVRAWPILVGNRGRCDTLLASPIILSDFPQISDESAGDLYDATEIDEMLTLRIRTLTPDEKQEMAADDPRIAALVSRCEAMDERQMAKLHGTWRSDGECAAIKPGMRVRLRPWGSADLFDLALAGKTAIVVSVDEDFDGRIHVSVALDDDPGQDYGMACRPGHRFFFRLEEIEMLDGA